MTAPDDLSVLRQVPFSKAVAKLEELLVQNGRAFLIGAGCSKCAGLPLTAELTDKTIQSDKLDETSRAVLASLKNLFAGTTNAQIEDYLSELVDLLAIAERRTLRGASQAQVPLDGKQYSAAELRTATEQIKLAIFSVINGQVAIETHQAFVAAVHRPLRVGKSAPSSVVDYLVLNYDTVIEDALALERVPFADGIDGGVTGWWNPKTFDRDGLAARVLKLHGSINWCEVAGDPLPRRIAPTLRVSGSQNRGILIWPASTKYRETQLDPFAQLSDQAAGDLTVIAFSSENEPMGQLKTWNQSAEIREQVLIFAKRGFFHGDTAEPSGNDLPWWKFENVVRLLGVNDEHTTSEPW